MPNSFRPTFVPVGSGFINKNKKYNGELNNYLILSDLVKLVNGKDTSSDSQFKWEIIKENDSSVPIGIAWNGNNAVITPKESGSCTIRITHPDAPYPLDILCRVITIVKFILNQITQLLH